MAEVKDYSFAKKYGKDVSDPTFAITITFANPDEWSKWSEANALFTEYYKILFRQCVYEIHKYLIRVTPLQTGRLRAGWTGILNKYGIDYSAAFMDTALLDHAFIKYDQTAIIEGMAMSDYLDEELDVILINNVPYGEYVEFGTSRMEGQNFTNKARYKGEYVFKKNIKDWFKEITQKQDIVEPQPVEEVIA